MSGAMSEFSYLPSETGKVVVLDYRSFIVILQQKKIQVQEVAYFHKCFKYAIGL